MWIALAGQVAAGLAIASAIGFNCAVGVPFASICSTMPFLLMGESALIYRYNDVTSTREPK